MNTQESLKLFLRQIKNKRTCIQYKRQYIRLLNRNKIRNTKSPNEEKWISKWSVLGKAEPVYYRLFRKYIGNDINIVPEDLCRTIIEPILDPVEHIASYQDKNIFDRLFTKGTLPKTIIRKMAGFWYNAEYQCINPINNETLNRFLESANGKIIIKPSVDSSSGRGIMLFEQANGIWKRIGNPEQKLSIEFINSTWGDDIIIQECLEQSDEISYFNPSSVNTIRLTLYRSVKTNECVIPSAIIRIGGKGSLVDNAHAGGGYVGVNPQNGELFHRVLNQYGVSTDVFNDIDFKETHIINNWDKVIDFAKYIGENILHHRLLALDIMIDKKGEPRLIEFNCFGYSMWLFQFSSGSAFGQYTDEIIEYCKENKNKAKQSVVL